jgi:pyruvate dehydrogenase E2 component (dihydrolipoamide acetyltransferase)
MAGSSPAMTVWGREVSEITAITMPKWGLTMTEGKILGWLKGEGEDFRAGEELLEIETSKITNVMEASEAGRLRRIVAGEGTTLPIGGLLAVVAATSVPDAEIDAFIAAFVAPEPAVDAADDAAGAAPKDVQAGEYRLRYRELGAGDGPPVVFIHGFGADLNTWMFNQPALAESRRTISLDLPGHGGSEKQVSSPKALMFGVVNDALHALNLDRVHLVGHSMGGAIALSLAAGRPEAVTSLTLIAAAGLGSEINGTFIDGFVRAGRRREMQEVLNLLVHDPALVGRQMIEDVLRYKRLDGVTAALEIIARAWFAGNRQVVDLRSELVVLQMPTQLIWGREDRIIPVKHAEALADRVPVHIIDGAGHLPHMEKSGEVNRLIAGFLAAHP